MENVDTIRLNCLSDPKFKFGYTIRADGQVVLESPNPALCANLRTAIDYARCFRGEQPFCIKCKNPLNESNMLWNGGKTRYYCPKCDTSFNWP